MVRAALSITLGPLIWATHLAVVYGVHSFGCARDLFGTGLIELILVGATVCAVLGVAVGLAVGVPARLEQELRFERGVAIGLAGLSVFGILAAGVAALLIPACVPLR